MKRGQWSNQWGFILASSGSAVGLGNIWKFPYITHHHGGGAFVLVYLLCVALVGLPIMLAEIYLGKRSQKNPVGAFRFLKQESRFWPWVGGMAVLCAAIILSYYTVVAGWVLHYVWLSLKGGLPGTGGEEAAHYFTAFAGDSALQLFYHTVMTAGVMAIVYRGIQRGVEKANKILMPLLILALLFLSAYVTMEHEGGRALRFLFSPENFSQLKGGAILEALGHAFFTLSLGMGAILTYGSYMDRKAGVMKSAICIVFADLGIAFLACFLIYAILFSQGEEVAGGPGLLFVTLPTVIEQATGSQLASALFFVLVLFAALTSAISLLEVVVAFIVDTFSWGRKGSVLLAGTVIFLMGIPSALSMGWLSDHLIWGKTVFDLLDHFVSNWLLPIGGLLTALFVGFVANEKGMEEEMKQPWPMLYFLWRSVLRYVTPVLVVLVIAKTTGLII